MKAGIVIEDWKLPIFKKHLDAAGFTYTEHLNFTPTTMVLNVTCEFASELQPVVEAAQAECHRAAGDYKPEHL